MKKQTNAFIAAILIFLSLIACNEAPKKDPVTPPVTNPEPVAEDPYVEIRDPEFEKTHIVGFLDGISKTMYVLPNQKETVLEYLEAKKISSDSFSVTKTVNDTNITMLFGFSGVRIEREELAAKAALVTITDSVEIDSNIYHMKIFDKAMCKQVQTYGEDCKAAGNKGIITKRFPLSHCKEGTEYCVEITKISRSISIASRSDCTGKLYIKKKYRGFTCEN